MNKMTEYMDKIEKQLEQEKQNRERRINNFNNYQLCALNRESRISQFIINFPVDYYERLINQEAG